jgi:hypothetical protein
MKTPIRPILAFVLAALSWLARGADLPHTVAMRADSLAAARQSLAQGGEPKLTAAVKQLRSEADRLLTMKPRSVMEKKRVAASGDKHDYFSLATYWWPDPSKPDGRPYLRHDGRRNPEIQQGDHDGLGWTCSAVKTLALAYWFTGDERYAEKAATLLRIWFLDPATRMNPNLQYAQAIMGVNDGRGIGIIDSRGLVDLADGVALLAGSRAWHPADEDAMRTWLGDFWTWLTTSPHGKAEAAEKNNHGSWYDFQAAGLALALNHPAAAKAIIAAAPRKRITVQLEPDGSQPMELARTKSLNYSLFNLEALTGLAVMGEKVGIDLWGFSTPDGRSLATALNYLARYADPRKQWPKEDIEQADRARVAPLLAEGLRHQDNATWRELLAKFAGAPAPGEHWRLTWTAQR